MRVMISCGEPSGDLYAGALATEILRRVPGTSITGFGGERLRAAGATLVGDFHGISVTGLLEVARVLPKTYATYRRLIESAESQRPDVFVAIDFPDFNFRLATAMRRLGVPVVYYISPQLWAWRPGRMKTMKRITDQVLVIFKFEEALYRHAGVPVEWVGHPLLDVMPESQPRELFLASIGLSASKPIVALLPGSRRNELRAILPGLVDAAKRIRERRPDVQFVVARAPHLMDELFAPLAELDRGSHHGRVAVVNDRTDAVLATADVALVASGTVTVQAALHECPMIVVYRLSPLTYRLGRPFVHVDTFAMANLVAGRRVVPELIQDDFTPQAVASQAMTILEDPAARDRMRAELREVRAQLGPPGASGRAAQAVIDVARRSRLS
ncbi:MAG TPA: lipid-A-disaccharide synthase [Vicinamibacterales bacterium]|jgi:lipid-A-disaccharide synthase|nr:lipid-A-disaccharide synthase [Vicinamibacterales bacterium]